MTKPKKYKLLKDWVTPHGTLNRDTVYVKCADPWRPQAGEPWDWLMLGTVMYAETQDCECNDEDIVTGKVYPPGKGQAVADEINALLQKRCREVGE